MTFLIANLFIMFCASITCSWKPIIQYIDNKFEEFLTEESKVNRSPFPDNRVHCCLYFIAPTGHCLKPLDIEFMRKLHKKVKYTLALEQYGNKVVQIILEGSLKLAIILSGEGVEW